MYAFSLGQPGAVKNHQPTSELSPNRY